MSRVLATAALVALLGAGAATLAVAPASAAPIPTTTSLASSLNPSISTQPVTFSATVSEVPSGSTPAGVVVFGFNAGGVTCAGGNSVTLSGGVAQCTASGLQAIDSPVSVSAVYQGDSTDATSNAAPLDQAVDQAAATITVTSSAVHTPITLTGCTTTVGIETVTCPSIAGVSAGAAVSDSAGSIPAGATATSATQRTDTIVLSAPASASNAGTDTLTAVDNPTDVYSAGHPAVFTATVTPTAPATAPPSGTLTWSITGADASSVDCASGDVVNVTHSGVLTCRVPQGQLLASGSPYTVTASYGGSSSFGSASGSFDQVITPAPSRTFVSGSRVPVDAGTPVSFTASVVPSKFGATATGTVTFTFTSIPFKVGGCSLSTSSAVVRCSGGLGNALVGDAVSDLTTSGALTAGTTVIAVGSGQVTLSSTPTAALTGQQLLFTPASGATPAISCSGGGSTNTLVLTSTGATCTITSGLTLAHAPYGLVVTYGGDANNGTSVSHQLSLRVVT